jgi:hypothetical protein
MLQRSLVALLLLAAASCNRDSKEAAPPTKAKVVAELPASLVLKTPPPGAIGVYDARTGGVEGGEVVLTGRAKDFVDTQAVFTLADMSLASCAEEGDGCATPWDYCCVDATKLAQGTAMVEVHQGDAVAKGSLLGWNGLDHLKQVVVKGKFQRDANGNVSVIADGVYVQD